VAPDKIFKVLAMAGIGGFHQGKPLMGLEMKGAYFFGNEQNSFVDKDVQLAGEVHVPE
jgi:hypothetical protein